MSKKCENQPVLCIRITPFLQVKSLSLLPCLAPVPWTYKNVTHYGKHSPSGGTLSDFFFLIFPPFIITLSSA